MKWRRFKYDLDSMQTRASSLQQASPIPCAPTCWEVPPTLARLGDEGEGLGLRLFGLPLGGVPRSADEPRMEAARGEIPRAGPLGVASPDNLGDATSAEERIRVSRETYETYDPRIIWEDFTFLKLALLHNINTCGTDGQTLLLRCKKYVSVKENVHCTACWCKLCQNAIAFPTLNRIQRLRQDVQIQTICLSRR